MCRLVTAIPLVFASIISLVLTSSTTESIKYPVILVPGDGGSQVFGKSKENNVPFPLWLNLKYFLESGYLDDYLSLKSENQTDRNSSDDVEAIFPGWGETWPVENLDTTKHSSTTYYGHLVSSLIKDPFFISNLTLRGASYDFRKSPRENRPFVDKMKFLIEETYRNAQDRPTIFVCHSLGTFYCLNFLNKMSDSWKKKYIKAYVAISGPLGGSVKALKVELSGDNFGVSLLTPLNFRHMLRSFPSTAFLLPDKRLWASDEMFIATPKRNYSVNDYEQLFNDMGFPLGYRMMLETKSFVDGFKGPTGVAQVHCIHGAHINTPSKMTYSEANMFYNGFPDQNPTLTYAAGDGTVPQRSLEVCERWNGVQHQVLPGAEHV